MHQVKLLKMLLIGEPAQYVCKRDCLNIESSDLHANHIPLLVIREYFLNYMITVWLCQTVFADQPERDFLDWAHLWHLGYLRFDKVGQFDDCIRYCANSLCIKL